HRRPAPTDRPSLASQAGRPQCPRPPPGAPSLPPDLHTLRIPVTAAAPPAHPCRQHPHGHHPIPHRPLPRQIQPPPLPLHALHPHQPRHRIHLHCGRQNRLRLLLTHPRRRPRDPPLLHIHLPRTERRGQVVQRRPRLTQLCLRPPHVHRLLPHREQLGHVRAGQPLDQVGEHPLVEQHKVTEHTVVLAALVLHRPAVALRERRQRFPAHTTQVQAAAEVTPRRRRGLRAGRVG